MAYTLRYAEELRDSSEYFSETPGERSMHTDKKQLAMATQLIEAYSQPFDLDAFKDDYETALRELIEAKQKNIPLPFADKGAKPTKVINLMDALRQSVSKAKKPVASERRTTRAASAASQGSGPRRRKQAQASSCISYGRRTKTEICASRTAGPSADAIPIDARLQRDGRAARR